jgi:hypothetical protein
MVDIAFDAAFFLVGMALAAFVLWRQPKWDPVNVSRSNFTLRVPSAVLLVMLGFAVASIGAWFRYERFADARTNLASRLQSAEADRERLKADAAEARADLQRSRAFDLVVELTIPEAVSRKLNSLDSRTRSQVTLQGLVRKPGDPAPRIREVFIGETNPGVVTVRIGDLNAGDRVSFAVQDGPDRWVSDTFAVPATTRMEMKKAQ